MQQNNCHNAALISALAARAQATQAQQAGPPRMMLASRDPSASSTPNSQVSSHGSQELSFGIGRLLNNNVHVSAAQQPMLNLPVPPAVNTSGMSNFPGVLPAVQPTPSVSQINRMIAMSAQANQLPVVTSHSATPASAFPRGFMGAASTAANPAALLGQMPGLAPNWPQITGAGLPATGLNSHGLPVVPNNTYG